MFDLHNDFALQFLSSCIPLANVYCELAVKVAYFDRFCSLPNTPHSTEIDHTLCLAVLENLGLGGLLGRSKDSRGGGGLNLTWVGCRVWLQGVCMG